MKNPSLLSLSKTNDTDGYGKDSGYNKYAAEEKWTEQKSRSGGLSSSDGGERGYPKGDMLTMPPSRSPSPLFSVDLSRSVGSEYSGMIEDMIRMVSLQLTIQVMLYFGNATDSIFTEELFVLIFYIVLGVAFFWLVVKTLVSFH